MISAEDETLGSSVAVDVCACVVDITDKPIVTSEVKDERPGASSMIAISDVEVWPSVVPTIEIGNLPMKPVALDVSTSNASVVDELAVVEVEVAEGILSDGTVVSFVDVVEIAFPSITISDEGTWPAIGTVVTLPGVVRSTLAEPSSLALLSASHVSHFHSSR